MPGRALSGPRGAQPRGDPAAGGGIGDGSVASSLLGPTGKAEPSAPAAGPRRGPALRAAAAASPRSWCPSVTGNLAAPAGRGAGGALRPPWAPRERSRRCLRRCRATKGAPATEPGTVTARRATTAAGLAPGRPRRSPDRAGPLGPSPRPAPSPAGVYSPHRSPPPLGLFRGGCISDVWG